MHLRRPRGRRIAALLLWAWLGPVATATALEIDPTHLATEDIAATQALVDDVLPRLPQAWRDGLPAGLVLEWRDGLPAHVAGRRVGDRILLPRRLLEAWRARDPVATEDEPRRAVRHALVHELAHAYDRAQRNALSGDARLRDLAGWQHSVFALAGRRSRNDFVGRTPDPYELRRPSEYVAVNLEHFVLDPTYGCRRPALHRHFSAHFGVPVPTQACAPGLPFLDVDAEAGEASLLALDPARVYEVDYLLAEGNTQAMSRWGHSMLRLVVCAPGRVPGPGCRLDLAHHRVLSFRAFVGDVQISGWRGLTGSYPSRLFLLPLDQVIEEYTRVELRGLQSIPLRLQKHEIASLLERAAQLHWSYDGRYYFIGNNCAVETWKLLHDGVPRLADASLASITPTGLLRKLEREGIADRRPLADADEARRLGYYFEPASARYEALFAVAREALALPQRDARAWLALPPGERARWLPQADLKASAALLVLENAAQRRQQLLLRDELKRRYLGNDVPDGAAAALEALKAWLGDTGFVSRPAELAGEGYGLPQSAERARIVAEAQARVARLRSQDASLRRDLERWLPEDQREALRGIGANLETIGARLRALAAGAS
ncbi:DUF4105 domain-containing protein [Pseudoxanthomonas sp. F37]|uniref:DUF7844 domain-containing protein n=1 Tax=Pseudoxanthomonas TaxID=83618 RepID=UPI001FD34F53|nr:MULTISPECIES: DUF4105 domain-containing protein [Pseudoxanthomonas]UOV05775.1 DUF4105 domain-containing protein [Pseudoxanthomonas mexicana]UOV07349.1 DUF4105 domain-containing protein [Pseudoxanthomonas sp. F37]